jgi:hypothetical protein
MKWEGGHIRKVCEFSAGDSDVLNECTLQSEVENLRWFGWDLKTLPKSYKAIPHHRTRATPGHWSLRVRNIAKSDFSIRHACLSLRPSAHPSVRPHGTTRLLLDGFSWNDVGISRKSFEKIQVSLNSDKINGYFIWRPMYIYESMWLNFS